MVFKESQINSTLVLNNMLTKNCIEDPMPSYTIFLIIVLSKIVALEMCYTANMFNWWTPWALTQSLFIKHFPKEILITSRCVGVSDSANPLTAACQAPLSMGFSRQEYRSGLPFPSPGDLPDPGTKPASGRQILCHCATYVYISHMYMKFRLFTYSNLKGKM